MIDHMGVSVADIDRSATFYVKALAPLGIKEMTRFGPDVTERNETAVGFGDDRPFFWIGDSGPVGGGTHVAFVARDEAAVRAFHAAALAAGGTDHGAPGPRPQYGPNYYAAFVLDPDGANIEAVYRAPQD